MAYSGYLIKLGGSTGQVLPLEYMRYETYKVTRSVMDLDPTRDTTGRLHRNPLSHTASHIEFNVPRMNNYHLNKLMSMLRSHYNNTTEKKIALYYYVPELDDYRSGDFYVPDIDFTIANITHDNTINYAETRIAFIEY